MGQATEQTNPPQSRREQIFARAADLFWEKGYHAASMNDLADASGLTKASLYHHVTGKEQLLFEMSTESMRRMIATATSVQADDPVTHLRQMMVVHVETLLDDQSKHATSLTELRSLSKRKRGSLVELRSKYDHLFDEAILAVQESTGRWAGEPVRLLRLGILGMLNNPVFWFDRNGPETPTAIASTFADMLLGSTSAE